MCIRDRILIDHGRWTHGIKMQTDEGEITVRMVDNKDILMVSEERPADAILGEE